MSLALVQENLFMLMSQGSGKGTTKTPKSLADK